MKKLVSILALSLTCCLSMPAQSTFGEAARQAKIQQQRQQQQQQQRQRQQQQKTSRTNVKAVTEVKKPNALQEMLGNAKPLSNINIRTITALFDNDPITYFGLDATYNTDLKKKRFMQSAEYKEYKNRMAAEKQVLKNTKYYVGYDIRKNFDVESGTFSVEVYDRERINNTYYPELQRYVLANPNYGKWDLSSYRAYFITPRLSEDTAIKIEGNNCKLFLIIQFEETIKRTYSYGDDYVLTKATKAIICNQDGSEVIWSANINSNSASSNPASTASTNSSSVSNSSSTNSESAVNVSMVEQQPDFPGGQAAIFTWLAQNLRYPASAQEANVQGRVLVQFIIEKDGTVTNVKIVRGIHPDLDAEAMRVVKAMPKWAPGRKNGQPVRVTYSLPINFRLS